ncbi:MAG: hypothetical protein MZV65_31350 [Chromatiales bacterium]|nr:hypothetical protein [Chromatiales bacterium]
MQATQDRLARGLLRAGAARVACCSSALEPGPRPRPPRQPPAASCARSARRAAYSKKGADTCLGLPRRHEVTLAVFHSAHGAAERRAQRRSARASCSARPATARAATTRSASRRARRGRR